MGVVIPIISEFNARGINEANRKFKDLETGGQKATKAVRKAAIPAGLALVALGVAAIGATKAAMEDQAAQDQLARSLDKTTTASKSSIAGVEGFITAMSTSAAVADDQLRPALATLARGTGDLKTAQDGLKIALDVSAATGKPLEAVSQALSKAYAGNATALGKLDPRMKALIKDGASAEEVIAAMAKRFKGDAAASADTAAGRMRGLGIAIEETKESIGAALMPVVAAVLPLLQAFGAWAQANTKVLIVLAGVVAGVAAAVVIANAAMSVLAIATPVGAAIVAVALLAAGIVVLWKTNESFRGAVISAWANILATVKVVWRFIEGPVMAAWDTLRGALDIISGIVRGDFGDAWKGLRTLIGGVLDWVITTVIKLPITLGVEALKIGAALARGIFDGARAGLVALAGIGGFIFAQLGQAITRVVGWVFGLAADIGHRIIEGVKSGLSKLGEAVKGSIEGALMWALSNLNPFSPVEHGGTIYIGKPLIDGAVKAIKDGRPHLTTEVEKTVKAAVATARRSLGSSFDNMATRIKQAFDKITGAFVAPADAELGIIRARRTTEDQAAAIADAEQALAAVRADTEHTADMVAKAERTLARAREDITISALEATATAENAAWEAERANLRERLDARLTALREAFNREGETVAAATKAIAKTLKDSRLDYASAGALLGGEFVRSLIAAIHGVVVSAGGILKPGKPKPNVPKLAAGGIVTRPMLALIGEAGPEAVIPLSRGRSGAGGGMGAITITVNAGLVSTPDQIGQQIIEAIQSAQRRSGPVFAAA